MGTITERNTSSLVAINSKAKCKLSKESKLMQSKPVSSVAEGFLLRREVDAPQRSSSFRTLVGIPSDKIQFTPLRLEPQVTRIGELSTEVENHISPEQTIEGIRSVDATAQVRLGLHVLALKRPAMSQKRNLPDEMAGRNTKKDI